MRKRTIKIILLFFISIISLSSIYQFHKLASLDIKEINKDQIGQVKKSSGEFNWIKEINDGFSLPYDMELDRFGNIYITGKLNVYGDNSGKFFLHKYDKNGKMLWNKTFESPLFDLGSCIYIDDYDSLYVGGHINNPSGPANILMKFSLKGDSIMNISVDSGKYMTRESVAIDLDDEGNIYLACKANGISNNEPNSEFFVSKFDKYGKYIWHRKWGGKGFDELRTLKIDSLNNIYVAGRTTSFGNGGEDAYIAKISSSGKIIWNKIFGNERDDCINDIHFNHKRELIFVGFIGAATIAGEVLIVRLNKMGLIQEAKKWGGPKGFDTGLGCFIDRNKNLLVYGRSYTNTFGAFTIKFDKYGKFLGWIDFQYPQMEEIVDVIPSSDGSYFMLSISNRFQKTNKIYLFKYKINSFTTLQGEMTRYTKVVNRIVLISDNEIVINLLMSLILIILFTTYLFRDKLYAKMNPEKNREEKLEKVNKIKKEVIDLSTKFSRLKLEELMSKVGIKDQKLIEETLKNMIKNQEVYGQYFSMSKSIVFEKKINNDKIQDLLTLYESWEKDKLKTK